MTILKLTFVASDTPSAPTAIWPADFGSARCVAVARNAGFIPTNRAAVARMHIDARCSGTCGIHQGPYGTQLHPLIVALFCEPKSDIFGGIHSDTSYSKMTFRFSRCASQAKHRENRKSPKIPSENSEFCRRR
jgi:hypothetical protein